MQQLTMTSKELHTVITHIYPDLHSNKDFGAIKYSDTEKIFFEWLTDKYAEPEMSVLESTLPMAKQVKAQAEAEAAAAKTALLEKLGITEDEAKLLLGGN